MNFFLVALYNKKVIKIMKKLHLSTLNPEVDNVEQYLTWLKQEEFNQLLEIADYQDLGSEISDEDLIDISALSVNIYASEMEIDPLVLIGDTNMINTIIKRFLSTVIIFSLMQKGIIEKTTNDSLTLYKDFKFNTIDGEIVGSFN